MFVSIVIIETINSSLLPNQCIYYWEESKNIFIHILDIRNKNYLCTRNVRQHYEM